LFGTCKQFGIKVPGRFDEETTKMVVGERVKRAMEEEERKGKLRVRELQKNR
jgi:hypothetical protein